MAAKKRLGEMLVEAGVIDQAQLQAALAHQRRWGGKLGQAILDLRLASEAQIVGTLAQKLGYETVNVSVLQRSARLDEALRLVPAEVARRHGLLPIAADTAGITVVMADPTNVAVADEIAFRTGRKVKIAIAGDRAVADAVQRFYYTPGDRRAAPPVLDDRAGPPRLRAPGPPAPGAPGGPGWPSKQPEETVRLDLRATTPDPLPLQPLAPTDGPVAAGPAVADATPRAAEAEPVSVLDLAPLQQPLEPSPAPIPPVPPPAAAAPGSSQQAALRQALRSVARGEDASGIDALRLAAVLAELLVRRGVVSEGELIEALLSSARRG